MRVMLLRACFTSENDVALMAMMSELEDSMWRLAPAKDWTRMRPLLLTTRHVDKASTPLTPIEPVLDVMLTVSKMGNRLWACEVKLFCEPAPLLRQYHKQTNGRETKTTYHSVVGVGA